MSDDIQDELEQELLNAENMADNAINNLGNALETYKICVLNYFIQKSNINKAKLDQKTIHDVNLKLKKFTDNVYDDACDMSNQYSSFENIKKNKVKIKRSIIEIKSFFTVKKGGKK